jgi:hypothetical protein
MPKRRDYRAEYKRRLAKAAARGLSRSQARGHPRPSEHPGRPGKRLPDEQIQAALRVLRQERNLSEAARAAKLSPERLRKYAIDHNIIEKVGRRWRTRADLRRRMLLFSDQKSIVVTVGDFKTASEVGRFMSGVSRFLETQDFSGVRPFVGKSVTDRAGRKHPFETDENALYRLATTGEHAFEHIYRVDI